MKGQVHYWYQGDRDGKRPEKRCAVASRVGRERMKLSMSAVRKMGLTTGYRITATARTTQAPWCLRGPALPPPTTNSVLTRPWDYRQEVRDIVDHLHG